jgi:hypothetical protein
VKTRSSARSTKSSTPSKEIQIMPGEQLSISPTTTLPPKFTPSLSTLVKSGKTLGEIMEVLNVDEKEVRSRLVAAGLLEKVLTHVAGAPTPVTQASTVSKVVETPVVVVGPESEGVKQEISAASMFAALVGKKFRAISHEVGNGSHVEVKNVVGLAITAEWVDGPGAGGSFGIDGAKFLVQFEEVVDGTASAFKPRGARKPRTAAAPPPQQAAPAAAQTVTSNVVPTTTAPPTVTTEVTDTLPPQHITIEMETHIRLPPVELTDDVAMALGRLAALGMNSSVSVTKILEWARVVLDAQTKKTTHTWVKP